MSTGGSADGAEGRPGAHARPMAGMGRLSAGSGPGDLVVR